CAVHRFFFFSSRRRHTRCYRDWSSDVCSSDLPGNVSFGNVIVGTANAQPVTLTNTGTANLNISQGSANGAGFGMSGLNFPLSLRSEERRVGKECRDRWQTKAEDKRREKGTRGT